MAKISPFRAIRPTRDKVHLVATRPVYTYKKNVLEAKLEDNRFTFLHIINPDFANIGRTKPNSDERFELTSQRYSEFIDKGILIQDDEPSIYIYRQTYGGRAYTGIICGASIDEYKQGSIKKHEATITSRQELFTNYLNLVGYNAEPVLLSHRPSHVIKELIASSTEERPEYEFSTTDLFKHELWVLSQSKAELLQEAFEDISELFIGDGHHRSASSLGLAEMREQNTLKFHNEKYFLSYLIDEEQVEIIEFNRLIKTLNGHSEDDFLIELSHKFNITELQGALKPNAEHEFSLCLKGKWYSMICKPEFIDEAHPVKSLDAEIITQQILTPLLGIHDLKSSGEILFMSGAESLEKLENKVLSGEYSIAFVLYPVTMNQVKRVANNNMIMPPKSTWIEPKLRSGLTIYNINE